MRPWVGKALALAGFASLFWALVAVPGWFPHAEGVRSAAEAAGYNNRIAHLVAVAWIVLMVLGSWATSPVVPGVPTAGREARAFRATDAVLPVLATLAVCFLYFPPAYAWHGPFFEDSIHINAMQRMFAGQMPYRDFESLYGPLMLYLPFLWEKAVGFTLTGYYGYILVLELVTLLLVLWLIQRHVAAFWLRVGAALLLVPLYFNVMLGPNQNGLRKLLGVILLMGVAARPYQPGLWVLHGLGIGVLMGYSQEFGAATAIGVAAIYAALFFKTGEWKALPALVTTGLVSVMAWLGSVWLVLGKDLPSYFTSLRYLTEQFDAGEAAFPFYWTVNAVAVFGIIALATWLVGRILAQRWDHTPAQSDLLLIGGLAYAAVALKSGLSRLDQWHLDPVVLVLCFALVLPLARRYGAIDRGTRALAIVLVAVLAATFSYGQLRIARYVFDESYVDGLKGWMAGDRTGCSFDEPPVLPALACQNGDPNPDYVTLAEALAKPPYRGRPVFIYDTSSALAAMVGVRRTGYLTDEYIYGDARAAEAQQALAAEPDALVVMDTDTWDWLQRGPDAPLPTPSFPLSGGKASRERLQVLSSAHYPALPDEFAAQRGRWREFIGNWIATAYQPAFTAGRRIVLERKR